MSLRRKNIVFDGDATQWAEGNPCIFCGLRVTTDDDSTTLIRVREVQKGKESKAIGWVCPDCVARMFLQVTRLQLWTRVNGTIIAAIKRALRPKQPRLPSAE